MFQSQTFTVELSKFWFWLFFNFWTLNSPLELKVEIFPNLSYLFRSVFSSHVLNWVITPYWISRLVCILQINNNKNQIIVNKKSLNDGRTLEFGLQPDDKGLIKKKIKYYKIGVRKGCCGWIHCRKGCFCELIRM